MRVKISGEWTTNLGILCTDSFGEVIFALVFHFIVGGVAHNENFHCHCYKSEIINLATAWCRLLCLWTDFSLSVVFFLFSLLHSHFSMIHRSENSVAHKFSQMCATVILVCINKPKTMYYQCFFTKNFFVAVIRDLNWLKIGFFCHLAEPTRICASLKRKKSKSSRKCAEIDCILRCKFKIRAR